MFKQIGEILIWSEDYKRLADWYREIFHLKAVEELSHPQDTGILFEFPGGKPWLWVGKHSEISGKNKDPLRIMINIRVESVDAAFEYLKNKGVEFIAEPFKAPVSESYFATFYDLDRNVLQIIGPK